MPTNMPFTGNVLPIYELSVSSQWSNRVCLHALLVFQSGYCSTGLSIKSAMTSSGRSKCSAWRGYGNLCGYYGQVDVSLVVIGPKRGLTHV